MKINNPANSQTWRETTRIFQSFILSKYGSFKIVYNPIFWDFQSHEKLIGEQTVWVLYADTNIHAHLLLHTLGHCSSICGRRLSSLYFKVKTTSNTDPVYNNTIRFFPPIHLAFAIPLGFGSFAAVLLFSRAFYLVCQDRRQEELKTQ